MNITQLQLMQAQSRLQSYMEDCPEMYGMIISTVDGYEITHVVEREVPTERLAVINSSMLALAETLANESAQRLCRFVILENSNGRIVSLRINDILLLTCVATKDGNLGMILKVGQSAANDLAKIF